MGSRRLTIGAAVLAAAMGLAGCGGGTEDEGGGTTSTSISRSGTASEVTKLVISTSEPAAGQFAFGGVPATVRGGLVEITLDNTGAQEHEAQLIRFDAPHTADEVKAYFVESEETDPIPDWIHAAGGTATIKGGTKTVASVVLPDGNYAVMCFVSDADDASDAEHFKKGMFSTFTVSGSQAAELPATSAKVTAQDYSLGATGLKAGRNTLTFENKGIQVHHAIMFPVAAGKTFEDVAAGFAADLETEPQGPPPFDPTAVSGVSAVDGGTSYVVDVDLKAGDYAFVCFITDRAGGPPHVAKGMISKVTVPA